MMLKRTLISLLVAVTSLVSLGPIAQTLPPQRAAGAQARSVIFILVDDLRFDALGIMGHPWLETPNLDALARSGVQMKNAFVTTALCSPSSSTCAPIRSKPRTCSAIPHIATWARR